MVRKTLEEQKAELEARRGQIDAKLKQLNAREMDRKRRLDTRRKVVVGALVLGTVETHDANRHWLLRILKAAPDRLQDRQLIQDLIVELEASSVGDTA
ncbi:mobilization protein C [Niveispirillum cyanobacteriorum]|uniref:mobilization protein C n=1 Tax=Niveispirillum cyanobacteriorum TaxID=1612173 RepID=UPI0016655A74|nr:mobilization protein C [Niveispirillum cyanobacteriorum]GGE89001.1 hypothetical protein GCM10011317_52540 [Niveispirillum cyanobacteriorum]